MTFRPPGRTTWGGETAYQSLIAYYTPYSPYTICNSYQHCTAIIVYSTPDSPCTVYNSRSLAYIITSITRDLAIAASQQLVSRCNASQLADAMQYSNTMQLIAYYTPYSPYTICDSHQHVYAINSVQYTVFPMQCTVYNTR